MRCMSTRTAWLHFRRACDVTGSASQPPARPWSVVTGGWCRTPQQGLGGPRLGGRLGPLSQPRRERDEEPVHASLAGLGTPAPPASQLPSGSMLCRNASRHWRVERAVQWPAYPRVGAQPQGPTATDGGVCFPVPSNVM